MDARDSKYYISRESATDLGHRVFLPPPKNELKFKPFAENQ